MIGVFSYYDLDGNPIDGLTAARLWANIERRRIARQTVTTDVLSGGRQVDQVEVSTVHLVVDHAWGGEGPPVLFETLLFPTSDIGEYMWRWTTKERALQGHRAVVAWLLREGPEPEHRL